MLLFRSEEHESRWAANVGIDVRATIPLETMWQLADIWYSDRLRPDWRRRTVADAQSVFRSLGLREPFWDLSS